MSGDLSSKNPAGFRVWPKSMSGSCRKSILVLKLDHLGDFIIAIPAMRQLRDCFSTDEITLVCGSWNKPLAEKLELFDHILAYDHYPANAATRNGVPKQSPTEFQAITRGTYDIAIDLRVDSDTRFLLSRVNAALRCGIGGRYEFPYLDIAVPLKSHPALLPEETSLWHAFDARDFMSTVLTPGPLCWEIDFSRTNDCLIFGPYTNLPIGAYRATFHFDASGLWLCGLLGGIIVDVGQRTVPIATLRLGRQHLRLGRATLAFMNSDDAEPLEFRITTRGRPFGGRFRFFGVTVESALPWHDGRAKPLTRELHRGECLSLLVTLLTERLRAGSHARVRVDEIQGEILPQEVVRVLDGPGAICIAPKSNSLIRDWPTASYSALIRMILERSDKSVILVGSEEHRAELNQIEDAVTRNTRLYNLVGRTDWTALPRLFERTGVVVCNNSGIAHFAAACGASVLAIYSGSHLPEVWGPRGDGDILALTADVPCSPCGYDDINRCPYGHRCMTAISPETVFENLTKILESDR